MSLFVERFLKNPLVEMYPADLTVHIQFGALQVNTGHIRVLNFLAVGFIRHIHIAGYVHALFRNSVEVVAKMDCSLFVNKNIQILVPGVRRYKVGHLKAES